MSQMFSQSFPHLQPVKCRCINMKWLPDYFEETVRADFKTQFILDKV